MKLRLASLASLLALIVFPSSGDAALRQTDPIVLDGPQIASLLGTAPDRVVAFRWHNGWRQVPVQVDERAVVHIGSAYGPIAPAFGSAQVPVLTYTDPDT